jgi:hypothetical protein
MTAQEMNQVLNKYADRGALLECGALRVAVEVLDVRRVFARIDVLVKPAAGEGQQWVALDRLTVTPEQIGAMPRDCSCRPGVGGWTCSLCQQLSWQAEIAQG